MLRTSDFSIGIAYHLQCNEIFSLFGLIDLLQQLAYHTFSNNNSEFTTCRMLTRILQGQITRVQPLLARLYSQTPEEKLIYEKLTKALEPKTLEVIDVSGGCGSMFAIDITSDSFKGIPMVRQHKIVNEILKDDIKRWHGLQLRTKA
ncbi:uncharacterized protein ZBAI_06784 [Zygosaccharomyces bailii ISA1307]|nr:uncharacterized protein ZBAI_06784 [Zygosaccharomyces bailii ISA1307]